MFRMRNQIKLSQLHPHPLNPRKHLDIEELASSIKESGLLSPLLVRRIGIDKFQILSGHRRKAALESLQEKYADCDVVEMTDEQAYKALMTANIQSHTLSEIEEAEGIRNMIDTYEWTADRVSKELGKERRWVFYRLQLLGLNPEVKEQVHSRALSPTHAREIAQLPQEQQPEFARQVVDGGLSTRQTAELVKQINLQEKIPESNGQEKVVEKIPQAIDEFTEQNSTVPEKIPERDNRNHPTSDDLPEENESTPVPRMVNKKIKASDYITKFYEFLANLDDETVDGIVELDETTHFLAVIDKAQNQLNWMRSKVTKAGETNVVEFRRNPA